MSIPHGINDFSKLPASIRDIAEALGLEIVIKLVQHFGGVELRIPHKLHADHKLMVLGEEDAQALCAFCPEDTILVPISLNPRVTVARIRELEGRGLKRWQIARELGVTQRHIRRKANAPHGDENQPTFFDP